MNPINKISIKNYRSIKDLKDLSCSDFNILIGLNDQGKSNILRALDLFFNYSSGYNFVWDTDFCFNHNTPDKKAKEIKIKIEFNLPKSFSVKNVIWEKSWRIEGQKKDDIIFPKNKKISAQAKGKVDSYLRNLRYEYVPAIKGEDFFKNLMVKIHNVLSDTVYADFSTASKNFINTINQKVKNLNSDISKSISPNTSISLPKTLVGLFRELDLSANINGNLVSLNQRGDGIRIQHIPVILKWLAFQANTKSGKTIDTIWGYEEPENNLELGKAIKISRQFLKTSNYIQIFTTTHSPAFYSVSKESNSVFVFQVEKENANQTIIKKIDNLTPINGKLGLMNIIASYEEEILSFMNDSNKIDINKPTIFCEGESDKKLIYKAIELLHPNLKNKINVKSCNSANTLTDHLLSFLLKQKYSAKKIKAVGIYDLDDGGDESKKKYEEYKNTLAKDLTYVKAIYYDYSKSENFELLKKIKNFPISIDELFPLKYWKHGHKNNWFVGRENLTTFFTYDCIEKSLKEHFNEIGISKDQELLIKYKVSIYKKDKFSNYIINNATKEDFEKALGITIKNAIEHLELCPKMKS